MGSEPLHLTSFDTDEVHADADGTRPSETPGVFRLADLRKSDPVRHLSCPVPLTRHLTDFSWVVGVPARSCY